MKTLKDRTFYKPENKLKFLSNYPEVTAYTYSRILEKCKSIEELLGKDIYLFNLDEIAAFLSSIKPQPLTARTVESYARIISAYINWAIEEKRLTGTNPLSGPAPESYSSWMEWFDTFVNKSKKLFFSLDEIKEIESNCVNAQDAVIIMLIFEGAFGKELSEIRNLKKEDVDFDRNIVYLTNEKGNRRELKIWESLTMRTIRQAIMQTEYIKRNGQMDARENVRDYTDLVNNEYVVRNSITRTEDWLDPVIRSAVYRRVQMIGEVLDIANLTPKNIARSGMLYMAYKLRKEYGTLEKEQYLKICDRFQTSKKDWWKLKSFINDETINEMYGCKDSKISTLP